MVMCFHRVRASSPLQSTLEHSQIHLSGHQATNHGSTGLIHVLRDLPLSSKVIDSRLHLRRIRLCLQVRRLHPFTPCESIHLERWSDTPWTTVELSIR
jgi:hypothetical protein